MLFINTFKIYTKSLKLKNLIKSVKLNIYLINLVLIILLILNLSYILPKNIPTVSVFLSFLFIFFNLWFYFINIYNYSTYTTSVQRFWKRTYSLFWIIEGFLFSIFLYLWMISPQETYLFIDTYNQNNYFFIFKLEYVYYLTFITLNIFLFKTILFCKKQGNTLIYFKYLLFITLVSVLLLLIEFYKFIQTLNFFNFNLPNSLSVLNNFVIDSSNSFYTKATNVSLNNEIYNLTLEKKLKRTELFFISLVFFLKFWHLALIIILSLLTISKGFKTKTLSMDILSSNHQNMIYIYMFFLINFTLFFKKYLYTYLKWVYFWFFENPSFQKKISYIFFEILLLIIYEIYL